MLNGLLKNNELKLCNEIYSDMIDNNVEWSNITASIIIKVLSKQGKINESIKLVNSI